MKRCITACFLALLVFCYSIAFCEGLFPEINVAFGVGLPTMKAVFQREADEVNQLQDGRTELVFNYISIADYDAMSRYWASYGGVTADFSRKGETVFATVQVEGEKVSVAYDTESQELRLTYPAIYYFDDKEYGEASMNAAGVLPDLNDVFGVLLPRVAIAIRREASDSKETNDGGYTEMYSDFTEDEYAAFSEYLLEQNCSVVGYQTSDEKLIIDLEKNGGAFTFTYDPSQSSAEVSYSAGTHPEPVPVPTPAIVVENPVSPNPTAKKGYTESECWSFAKAYFNNLSWKNPSSVTIHDHRSSWSDNGYLFVIDYSAQNGFGGYTRAKYFIKVNSITGKIEYGLSN